MSAAADDAGWMQGLDFIAVGVLVFLRQYKVSQHPEQARAKASPEQSGSPACGRAVCAHLCVRACMDVINAWRVGGPPHGGSTAGGQVVREHSLSAPSRGGARGITGDMRGDPWRRQVLARHLVQLRPRSPHEVRPHAWPR